MGLDMYAWKTKTPVDDFSTEGEKEELCYWRKHHDLHGWMFNLYKNKGGTKEEFDFNCQPVRLTLEDLGQLREDIEMYHLPTTTGFFFGNNPPDEDSVKYDLDFIEKAERAIKDGFAVYYDSWW
jgi:hypothetical protein